MQFPVPANEAVRFAALHRYEILDTAAEGSFDDLAQLAAQLCHTPIALITLVDQQRQWVKAAVGVSLQEIVAEIAFCTETILTPEILIVPDTLADPRFADHPLVIQQSPMRFYAGAPLLTPEGLALGVICVLDRQPRHLTPAQAQSLQILARQVMAQLEWQRQRAVPATPPAQKQTLAAKLQLYEAIIDQIPQPIIVTTPELDWPGPQIVYTNPAFTAMTGYSAAEVWGKTPRLLQGPQTDRASLDLLRQQLAQGQPFQGKTVNYRKDGTPFDLEWQVVPLRDRQQRVTHFVALQQDITERQRAESTLKAAYDQLEVRIAERTLALAQANAELQTEIAERKWAEAEVRNMFEKEKELGELKSRFIAVASHEFRTPLSIILFSVGLLQKYGPKWPESRKQEHLRRIHAAVDNMTALLNDILLIGKAEAAKLEFNPAPLNVEVFCQNLVEEMQLSTGCSHRIDFVSQGQSGIVQMDEKLLQHILRNLLSNAIKYSPQGGDVIFEVAYQGPDVIFQVKDQGIGILPEDQERLFESFHRGKNVGNISGTGLGLKIVKDCVELHGGQILVSSKVGFGTTFWVQLPANC